MVFDPSLEFPSRNLSYLLLGGARRGAASHVSLKSVQMAADAQSVAHLLWNNEDDLSLRYRRLDQPRDTVVCDEGDPIGDLAVAENGTAHVTCSMYGGETLKHVQISPSGWTSRTLYDRGPNTPELMVAHGISLSPDGQPRVAYSTADDRLFFTERDASGTWTSTEILGTPGTPKIIDLATDRAGRCHMLVSDSVRFYYRQQQGQSWSLEEIAVPSFRRLSRLRVDRDGNPSFAYFDEALRQVVLLERRPGQVFLQIPGTSVTRSTGASEKRDAPAEWTLTLTARSGGAGSRVVLGALEPDGDATPIRAYQPPAPPGRSPRLWIVESGEGEHAAALAAELRPETQVMTWRLRLASSQAPGELALVMTADRVPDPALVMIEDRRSGWMHELKSGEPLPLAAFDGARELILTVDRRPESPSPEPRTSGSRPFPYPNPFRREVGLVLETAAPARLSVEIVDVAGRLVRTLARDVGAGEHVLTWDGRNAIGSPVSPGVYFMRHRADGRAGTTRVLKLD
jgi:hypothetical protein